MVSQLSLTMQRYLSIHDFKTAPLIEVPKILEQGKMASGSTEILWYPKFEISLVELVNKNY